MELAIAAIADLEICGQPTAEEEALVAVTHRFTLCAELRGITVVAVADPVVCFEERGFTPMPSAEVKCTVFQKDPLANKPYNIDWRKVLQTGEKIATSGWSGDGLTVGTSWFTGSISYAFLSGGTAGTTYVPKSTITTSLGRTYAREIVIEVVNL